MTYSVFSIQNPKADDLQPIIAENNAPVLRFCVACEQCRRLNRQKAGTLPEAVALALASGWSIRIPAAFKIDGLFSAENLTDSKLELYCGRCAADFGGDE